MKKCLLNRSPLNHRNPRGSSRWVIAGSDDNTGDQTCEHYERER